MLSRTLQLVVAQGLTCGLVVAQGLTCGVAQGLTCAMAMVDAAHAGPYNFGADADFKKADMDAIFERTGVKASWRGRQQSGVRGKQLYLSGPPERLQEASSIIYNACCAQYFVILLIHIRV